MGVVAAAAAAAAGVMPLQVDQLSIGSGGGGGESAHGPGPAQLLQAAAVMAANDPEPMSISAVPVSVSAMGTAHSAAATAFLFNNFVTVAAPTHPSPSQPPPLVAKPSPAHVTQHHPTLAIMHSQGTSSSSGSFERTPSETETATDLQTTQSPGVMGSKRNRVLTRQPRVKRDSDSLSSTNQISPDTAATTLDFDPFNAAGTTTAIARDYSTHHHHQAQQQQHHHHHSPHHPHLLTVPPRIERHASEPAPSLASPPTPHLLSVPSSTPYLIKQHSDPLLPRQHSLHSTGSITGTNPFAPLHRQYSHPLSGTNAGYVPPAPLHHPHHISLPEAIYASSSPPPAGSSQYLVPTRVVSTSSEAAATPTNSGGTPVSVVTSPPAGSSRQPFSPTYGGSTEPSPIPERRSPHSPLTHIVERSSAKVETANGGGVGGGVVNKLRSSKSTGSSSSNIHLHPSQTTTSSSFEHLPTLRVKNEELQRSVSSPQTQREIITLENPRSSHCPVIRPGPALGCNFCWNTIDGHGRILRRKTKYHCPECQTNLCIVPCFQEYHERLNNEAAAAATSSSSSESHANTSSSKGTSTYAAAAGGGGGGGPAARLYTKTESI
ncbi:GH15391 [Drosophila grimshawi]|uniref:GH15391 n=1 Tax=Drosophila grimshawi TaxID=7222 RepID=B4J351_DROGR|nr:GH15391 [Drosophila grimshawi]